MKENKILYRDDKNAVIAGVAKGLADYTGIDTALMRVIVVVLFLVSGGGVLIAYILLWALTPTKSTLEKQGKIVQEDDDPFEAYSQNKEDVEDEYKIDPEDYKY